MTPTYLGNTDLLNQPLVAFFCSRRYAPQAVLASYDWATAQGDKVVISTFHSPLEKDVLEFLLKNKRPIIYVLPARMYKRVPERFKEALDEDRLLFVSLQPDNQYRYSQHNALQAMHFILDTTTEIVFGSIAPGSNTEQLYNTIDPTHIKCTILTS